MGPRARRLVWCRILGPVALGAAILFLGLGGASANLRTCHSAYVKAAQRTGVPLKVLHAIALTESGRSVDGKFVAWPWSINVSGTSHLFETKQEAVAFAKRQRAAGVQNFDSGCFQLNFKWHISAFSSVEDMFDPNSNAHYAAQFLKTLYLEFGDWTQAAGAYHSRTEKYAAKYRAKFSEILANLSAEPSRPASANTNLNGYPLLVSQPGTSLLGSLVPIGAGKTEPAGMWR